MTQLIFFMSPFFLLSRWASTHIESLPLRGKLNRLTFLPTAYVKDYRETGGVESDLCGQTGIEGTASPKGRRNKSNLRAALVWERTQNVSEEPFRPI